MNEHTTIEAKASFYMWDCTAKGPELLAMESYVSVSLNHVGKL